jgi:hypothetical protein
VVNILRRWLSPRQTGTSPRRRRAFRPSLESLEDRSTPAVLTVNSLADDTAADGALTLREAIEIVDGDLGRALTAAEQAQVTGTVGTGDTIQFDLPSGSQTIQLTGGPLVITNAVALDGPGAGTLTVDGSGAGRVFSVGQGFSRNLGLAVSLSGLTIADGKDAYGGGLFSAGALTLSDVTVTGNTATASGGGGVYNYGALTLRGCTFTGNAALPGGTGSTSGGALFNITGGTVTATGCTFSGNTAPGTGASAGQGGALSNSGTMTVDGSTIDGNSAGFGGGGVYNGNGPLALTNCTISNNTVTPNPATPTEGGGLLNEPAGTVTLTNCTFSGNSVQGSGPTAGQGGGLYNSGGAVTVSGGSFTGNSAGSDGGAFYSAVSGVNNPVLINNATFTGNDSAADGGAIRAPYGSIVTITGCTFAGNNASSEGGAVDGSQAAQLTITNSTFTANSAGSIGGAVNCGGLGTAVTFTNDTITGNRVGGIYGGGINIRCNSVTLENTIIAGNYQGSGAAPNDITGYDFSSTPNLLDPASSYNIVGPGGSGGLVNGTNHNQVGVTALGLGPLADNGGPTQTMALQAGSPAIDRGSDAFVIPGETDQRGLPRVANGTVDIGAFEIQSSAGAVLLVNSTADNTTADNVLTLREAIAVVDGTLGRALTAGEQAQISGTPGPNDTIEFDLPSGSRTITLTGGALNITQPVAIFGPGAGSLTINGNHADRVFIVGSGSSQNLSLNVSISDLTISAGSATAPGKNYGGGLVNFGTLTLGNVAFQSNTAGSGGGGALYNGGALTVGGSTFSNNAVTNGGPGGAIQNTSSASLIVVGCVFTSNTTTGGGSGGGVANSGVLAVTGSTFVRNAASANGGGISNNGAATVTTSTLSGNVAASQGGGIFGATLVRVVNTTITGNAPNDVAGLVQVISGTSSAPRSIRARLVTRKVGRKKKLFVEVFFADTGARKKQFTSPFQSPRFKNIRVTVRDTNKDGVADQVLVTARRGKRTLTAFYPA